MHSICANNSHSSVQIMKFAFFSNERKMKPLVERMLMCQLFDIITISFVSNQYWKEAEKIGTHLKLIRISLRFVRKDESWKDAASL